MLHAILPVEAIFHWFRPIIEDELTMAAANGSCLPTIFLIESENAKQSHVSAFQGLDEAA